MNTSNTNAHTPGPWEIFPVKEVWRGHDVRGPHGETITHVQRGGSERADEQAANARLIATAPNMLKALADAVDELEQMHRHYYGNCPGGCPACVAIDKARAAIAKATAE